MLPDVPLTPALPLTRPEVPDVDPVAEPVAVPAAPLVVPDVLPVVLPDRGEVAEPLVLRCAFARMNSLALLLRLDVVGVDELVDPDVPTAPLELPRSRHPVIVTVELFLLAVVLDELVDCAASPAPASATAMHAPIHTCLFMRSSCYALGRSAVQSGHQPRDRAKLARTMGGDEESEIAPQQITSQVVVSTRPCGRYG